MLETIGSIVLKYWVEFILGLIVAGGGFLIKRYLRLEKEERQREQREYFDKMLEKIQSDNQQILKSLEKEHDKMNQNSEDKYNEINTKVDKALEAGREESKADDAVLEKEISAMKKNITALTAGVLSMQGKEFINNCRKLLAEDHIITLDEWEELDIDHTAYNGLGGNHKGDHLFSLVKKKVEAGFAEDQRPITLSRLQVKNFQSDIDTDPAFYSYFGHIVSEIKHEFSSRKYRFSMQIRR